MSHPLAPPAPVAWNGLYFTVHGGALGIPDVGTMFNVGLGSETNGQTSTDTGYRLGGSVGYDFNSMFGAEAEVSYGHVNINSFTPDTASAIPVTGDASALSVMGNLIVGRQMGAFRPYIGVGAGAVDVSMSVPAGQLGPDGVDDSDWTWGAQVFVGVDFALTNNVSLGARYRYQYVGDTGFNDTGGTPITLDGFGAQSLEAVLKVRFGG
jgi:opacity protein-like surface antigen